jgi:YegS/Rv2252/BmrU family lipid kinase
MKPFVVLNPNAGRGRILRAWPRLAGKLRSIVGAFEMATTGARGDAVRLVRRAVADGVSCVIAVGGDGTVSEAVNGLCNGPDPPAPNTALGIVACGTGNDLARTFGVGTGPDASLARLAENRRRRIDLGRVDFVDHDGGRASRWFVNIASFGLSGAVIDAIERARLTRMLGARTAFFIHSWRELRRFEGRRVLLRLDEGEPIEECISVTAVANCRYFGGGMQIAPHADPADGQLEIIVQRQNPPVRLTEMRLVYSGRHLAHPSVRAMRCRSLSVRPADGRTVLLEVDGELPGRLPATFSVAPNALTLLW